MTTWEERFTGHEPPTPLLELLETCWRRRTPRGRIITAGIYRTDVPGVGVRVGFSDEDLLRSQWTAEIGSARELDAEWRRAMRDKCASR